MEEYKNPFAPDSTEQNFVDITNAKMQRAKSEQDLADTISAGDKNARIVMAEGASIVSAELQMPGGAEVVAIMRVKGLVLGHPEITELDFVIPITELPKIRENLRNAYLAVPIDKRN